MYIKKIIITGSPGTGKTSIINALKIKKYQCFDEIVRTLTLAAKQDVHESAQRSNPIAFVKDPMKFNTRLLNGRIEQFLQANSLKEHINFFDRGLPDVLAYMEYFNQPYGVKFINACNNHIYSHVFLLPPWETIYKSDNERFETFEESRQIHLYLDKVYRNFGYKIIEVPFGTIAERTHFILNNIAD